MATPRRFDPDEIAKLDLTEAEAEGISLAMDELDRGEGVPMEQVFADVREELDALAAIEHVARILAGRDDDAARLRATRST